MPRSSYSNETVASLYDALYASDEHVGSSGSGGLPGDVPFYLNALGPPPKRVLELGCGTGRVTLPLARSGYTVTGLDASTEMLDVAETKAAELQPDVRARLRWVAADWHEYELGDESFDAAVCPFSSFLMNVTIADQDRFLSQVLRHLKAGGLLAIDMFFPDLSRLALPEEPRHPKRTFVADGVEWVEHERITRRAAHQSFDCVLDYQRTDGSSDVVEQRFALTWFLPRELERMVTANGFELVDIVDPRSGDRVEDGSRRQVVLARRP